MAAVTFGMAAPQPVRACTVCRVGDPTLTAMGQEQGVAGRLRLGAEFEHRTEASGEQDVDRIEVSEQRLDVAASYAPTDAIQLGLIVPVLRREVTLLNLAEETVWGLGDVEARSRFTVFRDRRFETRHWVFVGAGVKLPTAGRRSENGATLALDRQLGDGAFAASADAGYRYSPGAFSFLATLGGLLPFEGWGGARSGASVHGELMLQYQPVTAFAVAASTRVRHSASTREVDSPSSSDRDPHSGGTVGYLGGRVTLAPVSDLVLALGVQVPVVQDLRGEHTEGVALRASMAYDF
ncbi:MAG: transporter [Myxococcota bacterium]